MSEPFLAEIKIFAGNFAPRNYAYCDGQLLAIAQNTALFSLVGTLYGGDGRTTFGLPDLRGRVPVHSGGNAGPGLSSRPLGQKGGTENETLAIAQMPAHRHPVGVSGNAGTSSSPAGNFPAASSTRDSLYGASSNANLAGTAVELVGSGNPHNNMQPYLALNFIIALAGVYPSRN